MTIKQALDEINATDKQKEKCFERLLQSSHESHSFMLYMKRYVAAAAATVIAVGTAAVGVHFAVTNNQGGPINVSVENSDTVSDSVVVPTDNTKVHSEKSGMIFVDNKSFWKQLGKITYYSVDNTPTIDTAEINAADDFESLFCTDKQIQSEMLKLFDNAIDITNKYIILPDSNKAVGISSDMSTQEIESFKNNSTNYFTYTSYCEPERFYYADKAYFGFDTSEEFINTVSQIYIGNHSDNFTEDFYDYCPDYIQPADRNNTKSKFGINIDKELPITNLYSAHTQYCTAFYTDDSHNSLILLSLTAKDGDNNNKTFELKYIPMKYVDGKLRIVVEIYNTMFMDVNAFSDNCMLNYGLTSEIETAAKTVDITFVTGDSDNSAVIPAENTRVHSEKSGMTFVDDKAFWTQLGKITYRPAEYATEISAADDFENRFCTDKHIQSEMLDLFDNVIDITDKYFVFTDINKAVGISPDMSAQEIEKFRNNSDNYFTGTDSNNDARFYYADKAYFGFDTSDELINIVSKVYTGIQTDNFTEKFYDYCPEYIQPEDRNNAKSKFGINIDSKLPLTELYSAHTQYCTAFYTDDSHNSLILLSLTAKDGNNSSKTFELKYISMRYVDGKLRVVVSPYDAIFINSASFSNYMFNYGLTSEIEAAAKTVDITSVAGDSDNSSKPAETTAVTTAKTTASTTAPATSTTTTATTKAPTTSTTAKPAPTPSTTATNVTLRMKGSAAYLNKGMLFYYKVDKAFLTNDKVITIKETEISKVPYINTNGSDYTFASLDYGTYVIGGPLMEPTNDSGFTVFTVTEKSSNSVINVDLTNGTLSAGKFEVVGETNDFTLSDLADMYYESIEVSGKKYVLCDTDTTDGWFTGAVIKDYGKGEDGCIRKLYANGSGNILHFRINNKDYYNISDVIYREVSFSKGNKTIKCTKPYVGSEEFRTVTGEYAEDCVITVTQPVTRDNYDKFGYISIDPHKESFFIYDNNNKPLKNKTLSLTYLDELDIADVKSGKAASKTDKYDRMYDIINTTENGAVYTSMIQKETGTTNIYYGYVGAYVWSDDTDVDPNDGNNTILLYQISADGFKYIGTCKYGLIK